MMGRTLAALHRSVESSVGRNAAARWHGFTAGLVGHCRSIGMTGTSTAAGGRSGTS